MSKRLALIGNPVGPWVSTKMIRHPFLLVSGLKAGVVIVETATESGIREVVRGQSTRDVVFCGCKLEAADWMRVRIEEGDPAGVVCSFISRKVA